MVDDVVLNILPDVPDDPDVPFVPDVPDVPEEPEEPLDPEVPDVPDDPEVPELPEDPDDPEVPDVPDVPTLAVNPTSPLPVLYDNINSEFETLLILLLSIVPLPVTPNEPVIIAEPVNGKVLPVFTVIGKVVASPLVNVIVFKDTEAVNNASGTDTAF